VEGFVAALKVVAVVGVIEDASVAIVAHVGMSEQVAPEVRMVPECLEGKASAGGFDDEEEMKHEMMLNKEMQWTKYEETVHVMMMQERMRMKVVMKKMEETEGLH